MSMAGDSFWNVADCSGDPETSFAASATFVLGDEVSTTLDGAAVTATQMEATLSSVTATANTAAAAAENAGQCGIDTWEVGVAQDLLGTECFSSTMKDLLYLDDSADPDRLYGGSDDGVDTTTAYPTVLSTDYWERQ